MHESSGLISLPGRPADHVTAPIVEGAPAKFTALDVYSTGKIETSPLLQFKVPAATDTVCMVDPGAEDMTIPGTTAASAEVTPAEPLLLPVTPLGLMGATTLLVVGLLAAWRPTRRWLL